MEKKKKKVAIIRMYIALMISNLAISDQLNVLNWNWFKVDQGGAHSRCKKQYIILRHLNMFKLLNCQITLFSTKGCKKKNHIKIQIMTW